MLRAGILEIDQLEILLSKGCRLDQDSILVYAAVDDASIVDACEGLQGLVNGCSDQSFRQNVICRIGGVMS